MPVSNVYAHKPDTGIRRYDAEKVLMVVRCHADLPVASDGVNCLRMILPFLVRGKSSAS